MDFTRRMHATYDRYMPAGQRAKLAACLRECRKHFVEHPHETGETYLEHLWFTTKMSARFFYTTVVILIHGIFPFLLTKAASIEIEAIYKIMKSRIPKARRQEIDAAYENDYCV